MDRLRWSDCREVTVVVVAVVVRTCGDDGDADDSVQDCGNGSHGDGDDDGGYCDGDGGNCVVLMMVDRGVDCGGGRDDCSDGGEGWWVA